MTRVFAVATALVVVMSMVTPPAEAVDGPRAVLRFDLVAESTTGGETPSVHSPQYTDDGIQWDIYGTPGAGVRPAFYSSDGEVSISVTHGGNVGATPSVAGVIAKVDVSVDGVPVGTVRFMHLQSVNTSATKPTDSIGLLPPATLEEGGCYGWPCSGLWQVKHPSGIHTHLDINGGCYRALATDLNLSAEQPLAMLGAGFPTGNTTACDLDEMNVVNDLEAPPPAINLDIALIIDGSGSMDSNDPDDHRKTGASVVVESAIAGDAFSVIQFSDSASVLATLASVPGADGTILEAIQAVGDAGDTDMAGGITLGCEQLATGGSTIRAGVLVTDGIHNVGSFDSAHQCFIDNGWPLYTAGLSDAADEALLGLIADETGGLYVQLDKASDLLGLYSTMRADLSDSPDIVSETSIIEQDQIIESVAPVVEGLVQISLLSFWEGSTVDMTLTTPSGRRVTCDLPGDLGECEQGASYELITIDYPEPGDWSISLLGTDIPEGGESVTVSATGRPAALPTGGTFNDDNRNTHEGYIETAAALGITLGCNLAGDAYCPDAPVTRAQMASFLTRALDLPQADEDSFVDDEGSTHEGAINALAAAGVTLGCSDDSFCPDQVVTRAQMASFLVRAFDHIPAAAGDFFTDDDGNTHEQNINGVALAGVSLGCDGEGTRYCPEDPVRRDQMASFLGRALGVTPLNPG